MKATLQVVNQMQSDGVISRYAIGGAIGATFYLEPTSTFDIDVFVALQNLPWPFFDRRLARCNFCRPATRWMRKLWRKPFKRMPTAFRFA